MHGAVVKVVDTADLDLDWAAALEDDGTKASASPSKRQHSQSMFAILPSHQLGEAGRPRRRSEGGGIDFEKTDRHRRGPS